MTMFILFVTSGDVTEMQISLERGFISIIIFSNDLTTKYTNWAFVELSMNDLIFLLEFIFTTRGTIIDVNRMEDL